MTMITPTLGKNAKAAVYHVIYRGEVMRIGETTDMKMRLSQYRSAARNRKNPLPMHIAMNGDWDNITFKVVMYVPWKERLKWEANEKKIYRTGSKWNGHEKEETHTNNCSANGKKNGPANGKKNGPANLAKVSKETRSANGKRSVAKIPKETLRENGKKSIVKMPKEILRENGKKTGATNLAKIPKEILRNNGKKTGRKNVAIINANRRERQIASYVNAGIPVPKHLQESQV